MKNYKHITFWENIRRWNKLSEFHKDVGTYFSNPRLSTENEPARTRINLSMNEVGEIVYSAHVLPSITWSPPLGIGGSSHQVNVFSNLFNLERYSIAPRFALDFLEQAMGTYHSDLNNELLRSLNPLWWFAQLPLLLIDAAGFNSSKVQSNVIGKIVKFTFGSIPILAGILAILHFMGWLEEFKSMLGIQ